MMEIHELNADEAAAVLPDLVRMLEECVEGGASIGFVLPLEAGELESYWQGVVQSLRAGGKRLLVAREGGRIVGSVQLALEPRRNGAHRAEVQKVLVAPVARRRGLGEALMSAAEQTARDAGRLLLILDVRTNDPAERLYRRLGFSTAGVIPYYSSSPDRTTYDGSTFMYKWLGEG